MKDIKIVIFRDFIEDNRISMNLYADLLYNSLIKIETDQLLIKNFQPIIPKWYLNIFKKINLNALRILRYIVYPVVYIKKSGELNHIVDQSYAHLLFFSKKNSSIVTVHDLIPILAWKGKIKGLNYPNFPLLMYFSLWALNRARIIIAVSESTKSDLINYLGIKEDKIKVIFNGISSKFYQFNIDEKKRIKNQLFPGDKNKFHILITGNQLYKNHLTSFRVIEFIQNKCSREVQLVCIGGVKNKIEQLEKYFNIKHQVILLEKLTLNELVELYNSIDCLLFPSYYEGFGMPPLEAMACGTPVVTSNIPVFKELLGDSSLMKDPDDYIGLSNLVLQLLENDEFRFNSVNKGIKIANGFSLEKMSDDLVELYQGLLND